VGYPSCIPWDVDSSDINPSLISLLFQEQSCAHLLSVAGLWAYLRLFLTFLTLITFDIRTSRDSNINHFMTNRRAGAVCMGDDEQYVHRCVLPSSPISGGYNGAHSLLFPYPEVTTVHIPFSLLLHPEVTTVHIPSLTPGNGRKEGD